MQQEVETYYSKAGKIAAKVRENVRSRNHLGSTAYEICESVEKEITQEGAQCAFPVNVSINEVAAHYTAEPNDDLTINEGDVVKIDLGAQMNGHIADTAVTVCYNPEYEILVQAAEAGLKTAMGMIKEGMKSTDVGKTIEKTIKDMGCKPIANLSGHSLGQYTIHAGKSIPNMWSIGSFTFSADEAYACEPFVVPKSAMGFVRNGKTKNIFALATRKKAKDEAANKLAQYIWEKFNMLPFALRWLLKEWEEKEARELLDKLVKQKIVHAYPILVEATGAAVAQAEHTFIPTENGVTITTLANGEA